MSTVKFKKIQLYLKKLQENSLDNIELLENNNCEYLIFKIVNKNNIDFKVKIIFPESYPFDPPYIYVLEYPKNYTNYCLHSNGMLNLFSWNDWVPIISLEHILLYILTILNDNWEKSNLVDVVNKSSINVL